MYEHPCCQRAIIDISMICETKLGAGTRMYIPCSMLNYDFRSLPASQDDLVSGDSKEQDLYAPHLLIVYSIAPPSRLGYSDNRTYPAYISQSIYPLLARYSTPLLACFA